MMMVKPMLVTIMRTHMIMMVILHLITANFLINLITIKYISSNNDHEYIVTL